MDGGGGTIAECKVPYIWNKFGNFKVENKGPYNQASINFD
jgi:hypothetical protein